MKGQARPFPRHEPTAAPGAAHLIGGRRGDSTQAATPTRPAKGMREIQMPKRLVCELAWCPQRDSNPRYRLEGPMS